MRALILSIALAACARPAPREPAPALDELRASFPELQLTVGRTWSSPAAKVTEVVVTATHDGHPIGVVGAVVVEGGATRVYLDRVTVVGQIDPSQLPEGARVRAPVTAPPAGSAAAVASGTATERANLAATVHILERLVAHDAAGVLASSSDDYIYDDFSGPAPLDRAGTEELVARFLGLVQDFSIVATPVLFAAGDDVVIEQIEHMTFQGRDVTLRAVDIKHFENGRVVREWQYADGAEVLTELLGVQGVTLPSR